MTGRVSRLWAHLWVDEGLVKELTSESALHKIEQAISDGEARHCAELCVAIEENYDVYRIWAETTPAYRATTLFSRLGVWDTERNNGALLYMCMAERSLVLRVDRGIAARCSQADLDAVVAKATRDIHANRGKAIKEGTSIAVLLNAIRETNHLLTKTFPGPRSAKSGNQLRNHPFVL